MLKTFFAKLLHCFVLSASSMLVSYKTVGFKSTVIPIIVIVAVAVTFEILWTVRLALTRDDVRFLNKKMACEILETRKGPLYPAPVRKFKVYNDKYENCKGAIAAMQTPDAEI